MKDPVCRWRLLSFCSALVSQLLSGTVTRLSGHCCFDGLLASRAILGDSVHQQYAYKLRKIRAGSTFSARSSTTSRWWRSAPSSIVAVILVFRTVALILLAVISESFPHVPQNAAHKFSGSTAKKSALEMFWLLHVCIIHPYLIVLLVLVGRCPKQCRGLHRESHSGSHCGALGSTEVPVGCAPTGVPVELGAPQPVPAGPRRLGQTE